MGYHFRLVRSEGTADLPCYTNLPCELGASPHLEAHLNVHVHSVLFAIPKRKARSGSLSLAQLAVHPLLLPLHILSTHTQTSTTITTDTYQLGTYTQSPFLLQNIRPPS